MICACGGSTTPWLDWTMPLVNELYSPEDEGDIVPTYPLRVSRCIACGTAQLDPKLPPGLLFPSTYPYMSGAARTFHEHAAQLARSLTLHLGHKEWVLDVGSNDGTVAQAIQNANLEVVGLDPARPEADVKGFFPEATSGFPPNEWGAITALNVFAHIPDPVAFAQEAYRLLRPDGWFVVEVTEVARLLAGARLDTIYHEHMWYWSRTGIARVLESVGFTVRQIEVFPVQGGAMRVWAQKAEGPRWDAQEGYLTFPDLWDTARAAWNNRVASLRATVAMGRWAAYGAAAKGVVLAHHAGFGPDSLMYVVDETPEKVGFLTPYGVPIVAPSALEADPPDGVIILAWNYAREIREKLRPFRGKVLVA